MEPVKYGANNLYSIAGNYAQMINPATNINGVVVRTVALIGAKLFTGPVKPQWNGENSYPLVMQAGTTTQLNQFPILLPPGYGLWAAGGNSGEAWISWDVL
ncbi:hypothetical protein [Pseudomonas kilonensis]|uniref:hypothetical protein n=1 Tax=Pseudomonas kilonensis TaxID=132476 RepID=UPI0011821D23|nr:hypothetical protein [Pseudomonas kilonensis]